MNPQRRKIVIASLLLFILIGPPVRIVYREMRQARLDHALIVAIKAQDNRKILALLAEGASGEARDTGQPASFREALNPLLDRFRHMGVSYPARNEKHLPALQLLYQQASDMMPYAGPGPDLAVIRGLLDHGAQVNDREADGRSPLVYASLFSNSATLRLLLARGADPEAKNEFEDTPLMGANTDTTQVLLEYGANIEARDLEAMTPLMWAARLGNSDVVRILLAQGANIEAKEKHARTPLFFAVRYWRSDLARILLAKGAQIDAEDDLGWTALMNAARSGNEDMVKILLAAHADVNHTATDGNTALSEAKANEGLTEPERNRILRMLRKARERK